MSYIWLSFCSGTSYCLEFSTTSNSHAARENYCAWLPSEIYSLLFTPILQHYHISESFRGQPSAVNSRVLQQVNILSFSLAISQTIVFHNCFRDCVFLVSFLDARLWQATYLGNKCPCVTCSVDKSYGCFTTNPLRGGIQVSSATRQSSVSWNFNRMSKTETKENKMDTI